MAYTETLTGRTIVLDLDAAGNLLAGNVETRHAVAVDGAARPDVVTREVLTAAMLAALLPDRAALLVEHQAATTALAAVTAERDALVEEAAALRRQVAATSGAAPTVDGVPQVVTNYQARAALIAAGLFEQVDTAVKAGGAGTPAYQAWEYANQVYRNSPLIIGLGEALGIDAAQIDALFVAAAQIE